MVVRTRQVGVAGIASADRDRLAPGTVRGPRVQPSLGIDRRENLPRPGITCQLATPTRCPFVFRPRHVFTPSQPSAGTTRKEEGNNPRALARLGRGHRAGGVTPVEQAADPAVKTSSPRLAPRDAERAVGGIRTWGENPGRRASSLTTVLPFGACVPESQKVRADLLRGHRRTRCQPPPAPTHDARTAPLRAALLEWGWA